MICIDSNCIIDFLNGRKEAEDIVSKYMGELATTEINVFEIFLGIYQQKNVDYQEETSAESFFNGITVLSYGIECGKNSAKLLANLKKSGITVDQNDCHIVSTMLVNGCNKILTRNKKHFSRFKDIEVISY